MNDYRPLTTEEIEQLQQNGCWAEDWTSVNVAEDFNPEHMRQVMLYGEVCIGSFDKSIEVSPGFHKHGLPLFTHHAGYLILLLIE